ncbi:MAG TPA: lysozyme [Afipia sp.]
MANMKKGAALGVGAAAIVTAFLVAWEGFAPVAKHEAVDPPGVITWCFGRTNYDDPTVKAGTRFTKEQCEAFLQESLPKYAEPLTKCITKFSEMPDARQAAFVSFSYNLGPATVCRSSAVKLLNAGKVKAACEAMMLYTRANGVVLRGLKNRREAERKLCLEGI